MFLIKEIEMYRTHNCGELRSNNIGEFIVLSGWVQKLRKFGAMTFIDLRDRYGITQLLVEEKAGEKVLEEVSRLGREYVVQVRGRVVERSNKNPHLYTGDIEIIVEELKILSKSEIPPFTIEENTDGGDELRMKYRYLDLRRPNVRTNLELRHRMAEAVRTYLNKSDFLEVETPVLIKSTPEGARDFVVPSRMNPGEFYALPQSPQTFKQLLMIGGFDRYYQIVRCFRDEDLRADRQPEFTQIDCEMSFVEQEDVLNLFEGLFKYLFKEIKGMALEDFPRMTWADAMKYYGSDKPDIRFGMRIADITSKVKGRGFKVFEDSEYTGGICVKGGASMTRKQTDELTEFVKRPQIGAGGLVYVRYNTDGTFKSSVDKFYFSEDLNSWMVEAGGGPGDILLIITGDRKKVLAQLGELRLEMGTRMGLRDKNIFKPLWVIDFPLLEWDEETSRFYAMHHPFTSPKPEDMAYMEEEPGRVRANAYDLVINGVEIGGGSLRIFDTELQSRMFECLGFTEETALEQFGFLMNAFKYGAPPHGGIAFGFDRMVAMFAGLDSIRDTIAFPKNNSGRDIMIDSPSPIAEEQLKELQIRVENRD